MTSEAAAILYGPLARLPVRSDAAQRWPAVSSGRTRHDEVAAAAR